MLYIGVDLGGTGIKAGVVNERGEILSKGSTPTMKERPYQAIIRDIAALCEDVAKQANVAMADIAAIGVGVPGICDPKTGIIPFCTNLGWHEVPFVAEMGKYLPNRVVVDNDATVAGYAESIAGVSKGTKSSVFITLGTGVGGGIVINGKPYSGVHGIGSEIGHMIIKMDGEPCTCGNKGCFERYASATAIIREAKRAVEKHPESAILARCGGDAEKINAKIVIDCAKAGDETAKQVFDEYVKGLAHGIVSLFNVLDPEVIVLGGGVSMAGEYLLDRWCFSNPCRIRAFSLRSSARTRASSARRCWGANDGGLLGQIKTRACHVRPRFCVEFILLFSVILLFARHHRADGRAADEQKRRPQGEVGIVARLRKLHGHCNRLFLQCGYRVFNGLCHRVNCGLFRKRLAANDGAEGGINSGEILVFVLVQGFRLGDGRVNRAVIRGFDRQRGKTTVLHKCAAQLLCNGSVFKFFCRLLLGTFCLFCRSTFSIEAVLGNELTSPQIPCKNADGFV